MANIQNLEVSIDAKINKQPRADLTASIHSTVKLPPVFVEHIENYNNPHKVTAAQVGTLTAEEIAAQINSTFDLSGASINIVEDKLRHKYDFQLLNNKGEILSSQEITIIGGGGGGSGTTLIAGHYDIPSQSIILEFLDAEPVAIDLTELVTSAELKAVSDKIALKASIDYVDKTFETKEAAALLAQSVNQNTTDITALKTDKQDTIDPTLITK